MLVYQRVTYLRGLKTWYLKHPIVDPFSFSILVACDVKPPSDNDPLVSWGSFAKSHPTPLQFNMGFKQKQTMIFLLGFNHAFGFPC
jgi:hypothetical protein